MADPIVIVSAARTPIGGMLGDFAGLAAWELGAVAIKAAVERAGVPGDAVDEALIGNCLMAGQGQAPARQAVRRAGLPDSAGAVTLSKMCGSGMRAMMFAHDMLLAGSADVMVAGGMESMTNAPHLMFARKGVRYGAAQMFDHMALDGLEDAYDRGRAMGVFAEQCVAKYGFTREAQDAFAIASTQRAKQANESGAFDWEMAPVTLQGKAGDTVVKFDEQPFKAKLDKIPSLKPAFMKDGTITAANASSISDGAAAPSEIELEFAAVTVPSLRNAGFSVGILSGDAFAGCSSFAMTVSPLRPATVTGAISQSKVPSLFAASARDSDVTAKASCASRVKA